MIRNVSQYATDLIAAIESTGIKRAHLAREIGMSKSTISKLANGEARQPKYETVKRLEALADRVLR